MRVGKKPKVLEIKKTRSCVVRLEKVSTNSPNSSPSPEEIRNTARYNHLYSSAMGGNSKGRKGGIASQQEYKAVNVTAKKRIIGSGSTIQSNFQTQQQQKGTNSTMSNVRSTQKDKIIHRSNKSTPASTSSREETPPPTIAAGRSRRAIKPNPKYASEDVVTPKVVRNVGMLASSAGRGQRGARKASTSSDDFYNRNSEDEFENYDTNMENDFGDNDELHNDKAYEVSEKDDHDSDFSVIEETPLRTSRTRGRNKKIQESSPAITQQSEKYSTQPSNVKRTSAAVSTISSNVRSAPSQLQQIRRSLASANNQRNSSVGGDGTPQKRKVDETQDSTDNEGGYSVKRKQFIISNYSQTKPKLPAREHKYNVSSSTLSKNRMVTQTQVQKTQQQQTVNGSNKVANILTQRRPIEIGYKSNSDSFAKSSARQSAATINQINREHTQNYIAAQEKLLGSKGFRVRAGSPKIPIQKEKQNNASAVSSSFGATDNTTLKSKSSTYAHKSIGINSESVRDIKDDSPNSTIDDFETMPTFTIVNVNDIINKKGDVLITKSNNNVAPTVIEFSESITLDDDDEDDNNNTNDDIEEVEMLKPIPARSKPILSKKLPKLSTINNRKELNNKKYSLTRSAESSRKLPPQAPSSITSANQAPQILNHKLGLRNSRVMAKTITTLTSNLTPPEKPAPRILNSMVAKKTQPVKPMIANMDDSADESFPLSLDEDEEEETEDEVESRKSKVVSASEKTRKREYQSFIDIDTEDTESQNTEEDEVMLHTSKPATTNLSDSKVAALAPKQNTPSQRRRNTPIIVSSNKKRLKPAVAKENSLAATNQQVNDTTVKPPIASAFPLRKSNTEKVVISKQGDKIIKKITCFETWYVINTPAEQKRPMVMKNQLDMPLIRLANHTKNICLPNNMWSSKVTLYQLSPQTLAKGTFATYTGDLSEHNISEEDRGKYQPSCVMFRRSIAKNQVSRMPYDRAVIFKNKTFYTNIEGKNVRLVGAPSIINSEAEVEILLEVVDSLTLQSDFIEHISIIQ